MNSTAPARSPDRILAVRLSSLGDVIRSTAALRRLRSHWPSAHLTLAVEERFAPVLEGHPDIDDLLVTPSVRKALPIHAAAAWHRLRHAGAPSFDIALDLQGTRPSLLWTSMARASRRAGRGTPSFFRRSFEWTFPPDLAVNDVLDQARLLGPLGIPVEPLHPRLHVRPQADDRLMDHLRQRRLPTQGFVVLNPFSAWTSKTWPLERYLQLATRLHQEGQAHCLLTGSPAEQSLLPASTGPGWSSLVGQLSLPELSALLARARLVVTGDSGPMHQAAALGTPVLALFGPTWPDRSAPFGPGPIRVLQARRPPRHHAFHDPASRSFMLALDPDSVANAALGMLARSQDQTP